MKQYYIYIMGNEKRNELFIDFTDNLVKSLEENEDSPLKANPDVYLVYFEKVENIFDAVNFKMKFEKWNKAWKIYLVEKFNPGWKDLFIQYLFKTGVKEV